MCWNKSYVNMGALSLSLSKDIVGTHPFPYVMWAHKMPAGWDEVR